MISYLGITQTYIKINLREVDTSKEIIPEPFNLFYLQVFEEEFGFLIFNEDYRLCLPAVCLD